MSTKQHLLEEISRSLHNMVAAETAHLKGSIDNLRENNKALRRRNDELIDTVISAYRVAIDNPEAWVGPKQAVEGLGTEIRHVRENLKSVTKDRDYWNNQCTEANKTIRQKNRENGKLRTERITLKENHDELRAANTTLREQTRVAINTAEKLKEHYDSLELLVDALSAATGMTRTQLHEWATDHVYNEVEGVLPVAEPGAPKHEMLKQAFEETTFTGEFKITGINYLGDPE